MAENTHPENYRTENVQHGKWQKIHILENDGKDTPGKLQNGRRTKLKMAENTHTGKWQKMHTWKMTEQKMQNMEKFRTKNAQQRKQQKIHIMENSRKCTP